MEDVRQIEAIHSGIAGPCPICGVGKWSGSISEQHFAQQVNHLLTHEGVRLLHVGQESGVDGDGNAMQMTVAVLGLPR